MPSMRNIAKALVAICALGHGLIGLGIGWGVGPVIYDPEAFWVRGQVGKLQPGLEMLFPRLLGCLYVALSMGLLYASRGTSWALRTSLVPCLCYHFGALTDALNLFREDTHAINADKMDPNEPAVGHTFFLTLSILAFVLASLADDDEDGITTRGRLDHKADKQQ